MRSTYPAENLSRERHELAGAGLSVVRRQQHRIRAALGQAPGSRGYVFLILARPNIDVADEAWWVGAPGGSGGTCGTQAAPDVVM